MFPATYFYAYMDDIYGVICVCVFNVEYMLCGTEI